MPHVPLAFPNMFTHLFKKIIFIILIPTKHKFSLAVANLEMLNLYLR